MRYHGQPKSIVCILVTLASLAAPAFGQNPSVTIQQVNASPAGAACGGGRMWYVQPNGTVFTCQNGITAQITASGAAPTGAAGGDLSGTYPNPGVAKILGITPSALATALPCSTSGGIYLNTAASTPGCDSVLFWDNAQKFLGVGTASPAAKIQADAAGQESMRLYSTTAQAAGTGGGFTMGGKYTDAGATTVGGAVMASKANGTTGDFGFNINIQTRKNGSGLGDALRISNTGGQIQVAVTLTVVTLGTCNAANEGARAQVNDSNAASFTAGIGAIVAAGGTTHVPVFCDGTNWRIG